MRILTVCHGNINRSPLAAAVIASKQPRWEVRSAGFKPGGKRAAKKLRDWCFTNNVARVENHVPQQITQELVDWADMVLLMDGGNLRRFKDLFQDSRKVCMLGTYAGVERIPDPGFMARSDPRLGETYSLVVEASQNFCKENSDGKGSKSQGHQRIR